MLYTDLILCSIPLSLVLVGCAGEPFTACDDCSTSSASASSSTGGHGGASTTGATTSSSSSTSTSTNSSGGEGGVTSASTTTGSAGGGGGCSGDEKDCNGSCVSLDNPSYGCDDMGCAPCSVQHAMATCMSGECAIGACSNGFDDCMNGASDGCETPTSADSQNCGGCGIACTASQTCQSGQCRELCGTQLVPQNGYAECFFMDSNTLNVGKFAAVAFKIGSPAPSNGPYSPGCISPVAASLGNGLDSSVLCPLSGAVAGDIIYHSVRAYDSNVGNPPPPPVYQRCDPYNANVNVMQKCHLVKVTLYHDGTITGVSYVPPNMDPWYATQGPFSIYTSDPAALQLVCTPP